MSVESAVNALVEQLVPEEKRAAFRDEHELESPFATEEEDEGTEVLTMRNTKDELMEAADERDIPHDDSMTKRELFDAIEKHDREA